MHYQIERSHGCRVSDAWSYRGLKTAILENELLRVVVLIDKGADIYQFVHKPTDVDFMWRAPMGVRDPSRFVGTTASPEFVWMDVYEGGWQTVLPSGGGHCSYRGADLGAHAEVNTMPWDSVITEDSPDRVGLRCSVRTYRTPFFFQKTLSLESGSAVLSIEEELTNEGEEPVHCVWGQHIAIGPPFLSGDCVIDLPGGRLFNAESGGLESRLKAGYEGAWPWSDGRDGGRVDLSRVPTGGERISDITFVTDMPEGWYAIINQRTRVGFGLVFPPDHFRYLWYWQSFRGLGYPWYGKAYNLGLEPFTSYGNNGIEGAVENGTALLLQPGQKVAASLKAVAYTGATRVKSIAADGSVVVGG